MLREKYEITLSLALHFTAASLLGLWMISISGCAAAGASAAASAAGPAAMTLTEGAAVVNSQSAEPKYDRDEDRTQKCQQLVRNLPGVEEIRRTPTLAIESREMRLERTAESYRWVVYRSRGSSPDGWRTQNGLDKLHFNPPLQDLLPDKNPAYIAYAIGIAETPEDGERMMSVADNFGPKVGTFEWRAKTFSYTVSKQLPCFPQPEE